MNRLNNPAEAETHPWQHKPFRIAMTDRGKSVRTSKTLAGASIEIVIVIRKLDISTAPTKARSRKPAYSQALIQNKIDRHGSDPESQAGRQSSDWYGGWC